MYTITQISNVVEFWLNVLEHHGAASLLGSSRPYIMQVVREHSVQVKNQWDSQYYLEMPLSGSAGADCSIACRYVNKNIPYPCYWEFDTSKGETTNPSYFLEIRKPIFSDWELIQVGIMIGRQDAPNRMVFVPVSQDKDDKMLWSVASVASLLKKLGWGKLPETVAEKLQYLENLQWEKIFIHVDRMKDGSWGNTLGIDILGWIPDEKPEKFFQQEKAQKLLDALGKWGMGDGREKILPNCVGMIPLPEVLGFPPQNTLFSICSHFKLRFQKDHWLPAKVYLYCDVLE